MSRTMTFRELVKRIHPDHNPHITDAGGKMRQAVVYKDQPEELYKLAIRWGVMADPNPQPEPEPETNTQQSWEVPPRQTHRHTTTRPRQRTTTRPRPSVCGFCGASIPRGTLCSCIERRERMERERQERNRRQAEARRRQRERERERPVYRWEADYNARPKVGDHVCVATRNRMRVQVVRTTPKRVYFYVDGKRTFASKDNVYVVRNVRVT